MSINDELRIPRRLGEADNLGLYTSWMQVAGYFDGDGSVGLEVVRFVLRFRLRFVDTWKPQAEAVRNFLSQNGIQTSSLTRDRRNNTSSAYRIEIGDAENVLKAAKAMLSYTVKKANDLRIAIDYLEGRITGNEAVERFNKEVLSGRRSGIVRCSHVPFTRFEGLRLWKQENARKAQAARRIKVNEVTQTEIRKDHRESGLGVIRLSRKYEISRKVIRRILRRHPTT